MKVTHSFPPVYNKDSKILILGSMPSIKSREIGFYYGHSNNRFWKILNILYNVNLKTIEEKKAFLIKQKIALWDVLKSCDINKSDDSSIKNIVPNDISLILKNSKVTKIYTLGKMAFCIYEKYIFPKTKIRAIYLPSPSSANATYSLEKLVNEYKILKP